MKTKRTYITPVTESLPSRTGKILQDDINRVSGGAKDESIVINPESDDSDDANRTNSWTNHLWEDMD
ncbi:MAG: hypothetical protein J6Y23_07525 [Prevotella sp.]|nr:hypothetical protein [Prevotella sp.]